MKRLFLLATFGLSLMFSPCLSPSAQAQSPQSGNQTVKLRGTDGKIYDLVNMRGQVVLLSFGATWCQPCKEELRALEQLKDEYSGKPVKFFWVSIEPEEEVADGKLNGFARSIKFSFPILRDATRTTYFQFSTRQRIPLVVFFDKQGRFVKDHAGMSTPDNYKRMVRGVLDRLLADQANAGAGAGAAAGR